MIREPVKRSSKLSRRLAEISRRRAAGDLGEGGAEAGAPVPPSAPPVAGDLRRSPVGVEELLPGGVLEGPEGAVYLHERLRSAIERPRAGWGRLRRSRRTARREGGAGPEWLWADAEESWGEGNGGNGGNGDHPFAPAAADPAGPAWDRVWEPWPETSGTLAPEVLHEELEGILRCPLERAVFLDLETGGLSGACVFLAGTMRWTGQDFVLRQLFARHYGEEAALIGQLAAYLAEVRAEALVTFNGKSFDVPFLKERAARHRLKPTFPALHVDLLHHARAAWRGRVPNCRLVTLEAYVCRRRRSGDVPGEEIPGLYHDFVREGDVSRLIPVFHHNLLDVITMDELLRRLV